MKYRHFGGWGGEAGQQLNRHEWNEPSKMQGTSTHGCACPWVAVWLWCDGSPFGWQHHVIGGLQCALGTEHRVLDPAILGHHLRCHQLAAVRWPLVRRRFVEADGLCACSSDQHAVADGSRRGRNMVYSLYSPPLSAGTHADHQDVGAVGWFFGFSVRHGIRRRVDHANGQSLL